VRILHVVAGEKWTGIAAVVHDWTRALADAGLEAQFAFVADSPLARRVSGPGWIRPLLTRPHGLRATFRDVPTLRQTLARERFDIVHAHSSHDHALAVAAAGPGVKVIRTLHHLRHARPDLFGRILFRRTRAFAFANREIAAAAGLLVAGAGPIHSPVVDAEAFAPGPKPPGIAPAGFVVGTVGKLAAGRGHEEAIAASAPLAADAIVLHVGKGERLAILRAAADRHGTAARNVWAGYQDESLPDHYRAMDVFLFTASGSQQGQRAILEAMATGLPIVALPVPGVRDLVDDGVEGFIAADVSAATDALRRLQDAAALRRQMGEAARRRALSFGGAAFAASARRFYDRVLSEASPGAPSDETSGTPSGTPAQSSPRGR
jgi:glycosyltransferase involved in cell wall biosynthesis